jgi:UDP-2,4-diacetamido-2,4,6-trideoxy-beta-L-altropyranose hydrolase
MMRFAFRTDASLQIGTGHVMRCLTLADALKARGARCHFITRCHPGHLMSAIRKRGHEVTSLPASTSGFLPQPQLPPHAAWLGEDWQTDAEQTLAALVTLRPEWLIVDHYALDAQWEAELRPHCSKLMVIDDLADRPHECDLLLDQTYGRAPADYTPWVPAECTLLCGSQYALLRPEFAALREYSLRRRELPQLKHLLITMGGVDKDNATGMVLDAINGSALPHDCHITVVMGAMAPWLDDVRQQAAALSWSTDVKVDVSDMAQLLADSDLAIGAAGTTSWERCCLGVPTVMVVLAANQLGLARSLENSGAAWVLHEAADISDHLPKLLKRISDASARRGEVSRAAFAITDGQGVNAVVDRMGQ